MGKIELCRLSWHVASMALVDPVDGDSKRRVIKGWAPIVEVVGIRGSSSACTGKESQQLKHSESDLTASVIRRFVSTHGIDTAQQIEFIVSSTLIQTLCLFPAMTEWILHPPIMP